MRGSGSGRGASASPAVVEPAAAAAAAAMAKKAVSRCCLALALSRKAHIASRRMGIRLEKKGRYISSPFNLKLH